MSALYERDYSSRSDPRRVRPYHNPVISRPVFENQNQQMFNVNYDPEYDLGFVLYLKNIFLPYFRRILALAQSFGIFDLLANIFGTARERVKRAAVDKSDRDILFSLSQCTHRGHKNLETSMIIREIPVRHFEMILKNDLRDGKGGEVAIANHSMNNIFVRRLLEIEMKAPTDILLKLMTYQEWVEMLLKLNKSLIKNMKDLEEEVCLRMKEMKSVDKAVKEELTNNRHDIEKLIKFTQDAYYTGIWDVQKLKLKSYPLRKVLQRPKSIEKERKI